VIRDHGATNRFRGMRRPPADHDAALAMLVENVPDSLGGAAQNADGPDAHPVGRRLDEAVNAMLGGPLAGSDGGPQHRAERRVERGVVAAYALGQNARQIWHFPPRQQRVDDFPVGGIPADQEETIHCLRCLRRAPTADTRRTQDERTQGQREHFRRLGDTCIASREKRTRRIVSVVDEGHCQRRRAGEGCNFQLSPAMERLTVILEPKEKIFVIEFRADATRLKPLNLTI
jgi:hypothetical protein